MLFIQFLIAAFCVLVVSATVDMEKVLKAHSDKAISSVKLDWKNKFSTFPKTAPDVSAAPALRGAQDSKVATFIHLRSFGDGKCHEPSESDGGSAYIRLGSCQPNFGAGHMLYTHFKQGYFGVQFFGRDDPKCERPNPEETFYIPQEQCLSNEMGGSEMFFPIVGEAWREADGLVGTTFPSREACGKSNLKVANMFVPLGEMPYPSEFFGNAIQYSCNNRNSAEMSVYSFKRNGDVKSVQSMENKLPMCEDMGGGAFMSVICLDSAANKLN